MKRFKMSKFAATGILSACLVTTAFAAEMEEVVVTGSFIKGSAEDAALPVDVLTRTDLEDVGNPSIIEMIRNLGVTSGNLGETNQFDTRGGQANEGVSTVNLRGLGSARTLVLINGKRQVATEALGVDISAVPSIAVGRVEILKDGAAALYGSDAIAGVVNFITRDKFEGLEVRGSFQDIQDSSGDSSISAIYGKQMDNVHFAFSAEYEERSELNIKDRDWALRPFAENSKGGSSSIGNPGTVFATEGTSPLVGFGGAKPDANCAALGGQNVAPFCRFQFTFFDNLIEDQETLKLFGELDVEFNDNHSFHVEALWADMDIPAWKTSPSYPPQSLLGPDRVLASNHPGLVDYKAQNPGFFTDLTNAAGVVVPAADQGAIVWSRMLGVAGRNGQPESAERTTETKRVSGGFEGTISEDIDYNISVSWSERDRTIGGSDMFIERMAFALDGLGGPNCDQAANIATPGQNGCEYYNPLSNAIEISAVNGAVNPQYNAAVSNSGDLINWLTASTGSTALNELLVFDAVFSGESSFELSGGNVGWALGIQSRTEDYSFTVKDVANRAINPCPFNDPASITLGHVTTLDCGAGGAGQLAFLAATEEELTSRTIYGAFMELALPITDTVDVQFAARYEDYGNANGGDTFDPKIAVSWQPTDNLTFRGSASSTFRGAPASFLSGTGTALEFIGAALAFKASDRTGNPDLKPETAVALNFGGIYQNDNFYGSVDFWSFDFEDAFQNESTGQVVNAYLGGLCADGGANVATDRCIALRARITPLGADGSTLQRIQTNIINGSDLKTSGIDFVANYTFDEVMTGEVTLGLDGTYRLEFESDDFKTIDGLTLAPGGDFVGRLNVGTPFLPQPELKVNFFAKWGNEEHRVSYNAIYTTSYDDLNTSTQASLREIDSFVSHDIHYINNMFDGWTISLSAINATDEEPPRAATDLNYDPYTHNPFGRMLKLGVTYTPNFL
ncbi:MAG: outer membrane receptor protein involved in Fe transport [Candidatus Azotimanducaceae bacterium]|jgi:iron complex outermembrane receptor protein